MELEIEIPSHFLCPISLQLMKDPVTIWTGITYDRDHIEKWFFISKNTTCPVTNQSIMPTHHHHHHHHDFDYNDLNLMITPNHNLRRLIQSWCTLHASNGVDRIPTPKQSPTVDRAHVINLIANASRSTELRYTCLQTIRTLINSGDIRTRKVLELSGAVHYVTSVIISNDDDVIAMKEKEEWLCILAQLHIREEELKRLLNIELFIDILFKFLRFGGSETREYGFKLLRSVYTVADPTRLAKPRPELFVQTVKVIQDRVSNRACKWALKLLMELNPWGRNRIKEVEYGSVNAIVDLLINGSGQDDERSVCELGLMVLDKLCGCAEGRADLVGHGAGLAIVSKKIMRVSHVASDRAVKILAEISRYSATGRVVAEMVEVGVVVKLGMVVQMECSVKTKERAKEILRLHSRVWKMFPCFPPHLISYAYPN